MEKSSLGACSLRPTEGKGSNASPVTPPFRSGENDDEDENDDGGDVFSPPREAAAPLPRNLRSQRAIPFLPAVAARLGRAG